MSKKPLKRHELLIETKYKHNKHVLDKWINFKEENGVSLTRSRKLSGQSGCINISSFNKSGDRLLTGCDDGSVWMWDLTNEQNTPKYRFIPHKTNVFTTNFLTDTSFISGGNDANVNHIQLTEDGAFVTSFVNHHQRKVLDSIVLSENTFITVSFDSSVRIFDTRINYSGCESERIPMLSAEEYEARGSSSLRDELSSGQFYTQDMGGGRVTLPFAPYAGESLLIDYGRSTKTVLYSIDKNPVRPTEFIIGDNTSLVRLFDIRAITSPNIQDIEHVGFSDNRNILLSHDVTGVAYNNTGTYIAASTLSSTIFIYDALGGKPIEKRGPVTIPPVLNEFELSVLLPPGQELDAEIRDIFSNLLQGESIPLYSSAESLYQLNKHRSVETVKGVSWFGDYVVTGSDDSDIYFYSVSEDDPVCILSGHKFHVNAVAVHQETHTIASSGIDDYVSLWTPGF